MKKCCISKIKECFYKLIAIIYGALCFYLAVKNKPAELAGFAVAGALTLVFLNLESFTEFSGAGFSAKLRKRISKLEKDMGPIKSKETEPDEIAPAVTNEYDLDSNAIKVLVALTNSKFSWRTMNGLASETKLSKSMLSDTLYDLKEKDMVSTSKSSSGKEIWGATTRGYVLVSVHESRT